MKTYETPAIELLNLDSQDIITTSGLTMKGIFGTFAGDEDTVWNWGSEG